MDFQLLSVIPFSPSTAGAHHLFHWPAVCVVITHADVCLESNSQEERSTDVAQGHVQFIYPCLHIRDFLSKVLF